jgi:hypothetical protein
VGFPRRHEHRLETNTFLPDISLGTRLGALPNIADCDEVVSCETVFITLQDDSTTIDSKAHERNRRKGSDFGVMVIVGVLQQLEHESGTAVVKILGQPVPQNP